MIQKALGTEKISLKLIHKLSANLLAKTLFEVTNHSLASNTFPLGAKVTTVIPVDQKKTNKKCCILGYRPVS